MKAQDKHIHSAEATSQTCRHSTRCCIIYIITSLSSVIIVINAFVQFIRYNYVDYMLGKGSLFPKGDISGDDVCLWLPLFCLHLFSCSIIASSSGLSRSKALSPPPFSPDMGIALARSFPTTYLRAAAPLAWTSGSGGGTEDYIVDEAVICSRR